MNMEIYFMEVSDTSGSITNDLLGLVSEERQERAKKFRFDIDRKLSVYSELLVRYRVCKEFNLLNKEIVFTKNKYGKPFLLNKPTFYFNISHTRNALAVAFSNHEIGIDVESIKTVDFAIANRFFTSSERDYLFAHRNPKRAFYEIWTKKEAYIKWMGTGLSTPLTAFNVLDHMIDSMIHTFETGKYLVSVCCKEIAATKPNIITITEAEMYRLFEKRLRNDYF